ncbi:hypothetical protein J6590_044451 [Homalodisca vitripennis]|nr:hypothetical protein J6590_044451 [Homalodisca vitripennis]
MKAGLGTSFSCSKVRLAQCRSEPHYQQKFLIKKGSRTMPAPAQRFALLALLEKKLTRVVPNLKPRSRQCP